MTDNVHFCIWNALTTPLQKKKKMIYLRCLYRQKSYSAPIMANIALLLADNSTVQLVNGQQKSIKSLCCAILTLSHPPVDRNSALATVAW